MDKSRVRTILEVLYRIQAERLARVASNSRVCSKQQSLCSNKSITIHGKVWYRAENRGRH